MSIQRIGKLERWILIHAYKKTVLNELPENWKFSPHRNIIFEDEKYYNTEEGKSSLFYSHHQGWLEFEKSALRYYEIYTNYFNLEYSEKRREILKSDSEDYKCFEINNKYNSARVSVCRARYKLEEKGLIEIYPRGIKLTDTGKTKAKSLMLQK